MAQGEYEVGETVRVSGTLMPIDGSTPQNPVVTVTVKSPTGVISSPGVVLGNPKTTFHFDVDVTEHGQWRGKAIVTGDVRAARQFAFWAIDPAV